MSENNVEIPVGTTFNVFMSIDFFFNPDLGQGGINFTQAGAVNLHAVALREDGQPLMSKDNVFFTHGFSSLTRMSKEVIEFRQNNWGYLVSVTKQLAQRPAKFKGDFQPKTIWQVKSIKTIQISDRLPNLELVVRQDKISKLKTDEILLIGVDGNPGQYIYIQRKDTGRINNYCWLCPPHKREEC